jgi:hypothetical protein
VAIALKLEPYGDRRLCIGLACPQSQSVLMLNLTATLEFDQGESPSWTFSLFQPDGTPFLINGYDLFGSIGYPFGGTRYLQLTATELSMTGPNQIQLSLSRAQTVALPTGGQGKRPNLALVIFGQVQGQTIDLIKGHMQSFPTLPNTHA